MKKNDYIVAFNGCIGLFISLCIPFVIHYCEITSHKYYFPSEILYLEYLSYAFLMLSIGSDILFFCQKISQTLQGLLPLLLISPPLLHATFSLISPILKHSYFLEAYFPLGITLSYLFHELLWKRHFAQRKPDTPHPEITVECHHCKSHFSVEKAFCPNCQTISPKVLETYNKYPKKHYLDFTEDIVNRDYVRCPHCKLRKRGSSSWSPRKITTPLCLCKGCYEFYTDRGCYEWSVISSFRKILFFIIGDMWPIYFIFGLFTCYSIIGQSLLLSIGIFIVLIFTRILWFKLIVSFDIRESEARLKANPNYPLLLANMGYEILDKNAHIATQKSFE